MRTSLFAAALVLAAGSAVQAAAVTFDTAATPAGTSYGTPTHVPGSTMFVEDGIVATIRNFTSGGGSFVGFNNCFIDTPGVFPSQSLSFNNVQVRFDFTGLGFTVTEASFLYVDQGGSENLGVNGVYIELQDLDLAPALINGVNVSVLAPTANLPGRVTFTSLAGISSIQVGGQEFYIDSVRAIPAPGALGLMGLAGLAATRRRRA